MNLNDLKSQAALGEDSRRQFKRDVTNADSLAAEMAAFANSEGGVIYLGVADDGSLPGLSLADVARINQLISNTASQHIRSPITVLTENLELDSSRLVIVLTVPKGIDKPYFDRNGVIWLKSGADKRRINSKEELRRLFQSVDQFHADELPTKAGIDKLDRLRFRDFLRDFYKQEFPDAAEERLTLLQNMNLATDSGMLNLAGVLLFAERPEWIKPQFIVKAIRYPGNAIHVSDYLDSEDFVGPLPQQFTGALAFVMRNLRKVQAGRGVNALGTPEIPASVFEELLVNALAHRDYLVSAPIRLFIFDNRIEIISPGHLPNNLTVAKIRTGNSIIRNPILVSYIAKGLLPYRGLGSGIKRALEDWPEIDFTDDRDGCLFTATVHRKEDIGLVELEISSQKSAVETRSAQKSAQKRKVHRKSSNSCGLTRQSPLHNLLRT
ncbi:MAG: putative DNA binding domain-containing protein [Anaerolineae bacterium]|uniref:RNA-binding domain-containing protein n=1 Tax=Candidatus Amarolinea dominans TaxID=3140696 RepID=UPI0031351C1C|nr:putative DNA binding domain-containing protein [Anaerolineae bacterium]